MIQTEMGADARPLPGPRDRSVQALLVLALFLQLFAWTRLEGYQLADSVEYMDRAQSFVQEHDLGADRAARSFAFSLVFVPMFALADWLGWEDLRPLVPAGRAIQILLSLLLILASVRLGARAGGRGVGIAAGYLVAVNPVFLRFSVSPVAGIAAGLALAVGFGRLLERAGFRRSLGGGLWIGLAFLLSYKSLLAALVLAPLLLVRDRLRHAASWLGLGAGLLLCMAAQTALDRWVYGRWGASLFGYLFDNVGSTLTTMLARLRGIHPVFEDLARRVYQAESDFRGYGFDPAHEGTRLLAPDPASWYLWQLPEFLVWPVIGLLLLGAAGALRRPAWRRALLFLVPLGCALVLTQKGGDRSFRLLLPVLPLIAAAGALGWQSWRGARGGMLRRSTAALAMAAALPLGLLALERANTRSFGAYWRAMEWVERAVEAGEESRARPPRVGSAYYWALFLRAAPGTELAKLPHALDGWREEGTEPANDRTAAERRVAIAAALDELDWLIVHLPVLSRRGGLLAEVNRRFRVEAAFYDQDAHASIGPVFALRRSAEEDGGRRFFGLEDPGGRPAKPGRRTVFRAEAPPGSLTLLDWQVESLPGTGLGWITYRWLADGELPDCEIIDRVTSPDGRNSFQNNHRPVYGHHPTSSWEPGRIVRESYVLVGSADSFYAGRPYRPLGGPFRRGDLIPCSLWMEVLEEEDGSGSRRRLRPAGLTGAGTQGRDPWRLWTRHGRRLGPDGLLEVGRFFLPVEERARVPDDGRRLRD